MTTQTNTIQIYTDGACKRNPGPGGWGAVLIYPEERVQELGGHVFNTTNNQMELLSVIEALKAIQSRKEETVIYSDSMYVINGATKWLFSWVRNNWQTSTGQEVANKQLWIELLSFLSPPSKKIRFLHVLGHSGIPGNERVDAIAQDFAVQSSVDLFDGKKSDYTLDIFSPPTPHMSSPSKPSSASSKKGPVYYLSYIGGSLSRHQTWAECEQRVKGQPGAKFKKISSPEEEKQILERWGIQS